MINLFHPYRDIKAVATAWGNLDERYLNNYKSWTQKDSPLLDCWKKVLVYMRQRLFDPLGDEMELHPDAEFVDLLTDSQLSMCKWYMSCINLFYESSSKDVEDLWILWEEGSSLSHVTYASMTPEIHHKFSVYTFIRKLSEDNLLTKRFLEKEIVFDPTLLTKANS